MDVLFEVALRGTNSKTTSTLLCVSLQLNKQLHEADVWRRKFEHDYNPLHYHDWWTAKENYQLQEKGKRFQLAITPGRNADYILYKKCRRHERLAYLSGDYLNDDMSYRPPQMTSIDLRQPLSRYAIFVDEGNDFKLLCSVISLIEASEQIELYYSNANEDARDWGIWVAVIDFSKLILEFSIPKNAKWRYFTNLEQKLGEYYWFVKIDKDSENDLTFKDKILEPEDFSSSSESPY